jgi:hypothetical protein
MKNAHASFKVLKEISSFIEVLIDRLGYRKMGLKPTAESFHRDIAKSPNTKTSCCHMISTFFNLISRAKSGQKVWTDESKTWNIYTYCVY